MTARDDTINGARAGLARFGRLRVTPAPARRRDSLVAEIELDRQISEALADLAAMALPNSTRQWQAATAMKLRAELERSRGAHREHLRGERRRRAAEASRRPDRP